MNALGRIFLNSCMDHVSFFVRCRRTYVLNKFMIRRRGGNGWRVSLAGNQNEEFIIVLVRQLVISCEIRPLAALSPLSIQKSALQGCNLKLRSRSPLSMVAGCCMLIPTAFAPLSIVSVLKKYMGRGKTLIGV